MVIATGVGAASEVLVHSCEALMLSWMRAVAIHLGDLVVSAYPLRTNAIVAIAYWLKSLPTKNGMNVTTRRCASYS
jgi:prolipoprotein diacylglyceryltransferase